MPYADMTFDHKINSIYKKNAEALGRTFPQMTPMMERMAASTDMGNVSHEIPSIHPMIGIDSLPAVNHQPAFAAHCITETADKAVLARWQWLGRQSILPRNRPSSKGLFSVEKLKLEAPANGYDTNTRIKFASS
jgi:hypothetical protein